MQWIKCSDRLPTEADGDELGQIITRLMGCSLSLYDWDEINEDDGEWLAGACKREGEEVSE